MKTDGEVGNLSVFTLFPVYYCSSCSYHLLGVFGEPWSSDSPLQFLFSLLLEDFAWDRDLGLFSSLVFHN